jgi:hypothetical protein
MGDMADLAQQRADMERVWSLIDHFERRSREAKTNAIKNHAIGKLDQPYNRWLGREVTMQDRLWVDIHGNVLLLDNMDKPYLLNVLCFLYESHYEDIQPPRKNPLVQALRDRILA